MTPLPLTVVADRGLQHLRDGSQFGGRLGRTEPRVDADLAVRVSQDVEGTPVGGLFPGGASSSGTGSS